MATKKATRSGFSLSEESPDDLTIKQNNKIICKIDLVGKEIVWVNEQ